MAGGIYPGAHGRNEILQLPILHNAEAGTDGRQLSLHATFQIGTVAFTAVLIRQDIFAVLRGRTVWRSLDGTARYGFSSGKHTGSQHHQPERVDLIGRIRRRLPGGRLTADVGDKSFDILIAQLPRIRVRHHDQPATAGIYAVPDRAKNLAIRPVSQLPGRRQVRRYKGADANRKMLADVHAACECPGLRMAGTAETVGDGTAALNLALGPGDLEGWDGGGARVEF